MLGRLFPDAYHNHFFRYVIVGSTTIAIDFILLVFMHGTLGINLTVAVTTAYWASIVYNFCLNRWWTFSITELKNLHRHLIIYLLVLGFNYTFTVVFVDIATHYMHYTYAKILAIAVQLSWTYLVYKNVIFKTEMS